MEWELLPNELLVKIFSSLNFRDVLHCLRLDKKSHGVISANWRRMKKTSLSNILIQRDSENRFVITVSKATMFAPRKDWICTLDEASGSETNTDAASASDFYNNHANFGLKWDSANKRQSLAVSNVLDALYEHMNFLCEKATSAALSVRSLTNEEMDAVASCYEMNDSSTGHLHLFLKDGLSLVSASRLIQASKAESCNIRLPAGITIDQLPLLTDSSVFRKMWWITLAPTDSAIPLDDEFLAKIEADTIEVEDAAVTDITIDGVLGLIEKWSNGTRLLTSLKMGHRMFESDISRAAVEMQLRRRHVPFKYIPNNGEDFHVLYRSADREVPEDAQMPHLKLYFEESSICIEEYDEGDGLGGADDAFDEDEEESEEDEELELP